MNFSKNDLSKIYNLDPVDIGGQSQKNQDFYMTKVLAIMFGVIFLLRKI
jgi:hypothetical protein